MKRLNLTKKNIELLISSLIVNIAVAFLFTMNKEANKLTAFSDALLIISLVHLAIGAINLNRLHGDFDGIAYYFSKGGQYSKNMDSQEDFDTFEAKRQDEREGKANIPLYAGAIGLIICLIITYVII